MSALPRVSMVTAVRDGERWLKQAIDSVLGQTFADFEFIIVDDGSTDRTPDLLHVYAQHDARVRVLRQGREGLTPALNRGLAEARGDLVARLDADDVALPERFARQVEYLDQHPSILLLGSWADLIDADGKITGRLRPESNPHLLSKILMRTNPFVSSSTMFRTAVMHTIGGYRAPFEMGEDYDMWLRISELGEVANLPEVMVQYRIHDINVTRLRPVREVFCARLALSAAASRRKSGRDPASALKSLPDWSSPDADVSFYADAAKICRFLALADANYANSVNLADIDLNEFKRHLPLLFHRERKLAQLSIVNLLARRGRPPQLSTITLLICLWRLHPLRAVGLTLRVFKNGNVF
jgi:glycosyltransferase involved in cell wall biosynthesis